MNDEVAGTEGGNGMTNTLTVLESRKSYSERRLNQFREKVEAIEALKGLPNLCIYVTGSYGRLEASPYSDLDLFFIHQGSSLSNRVPRIQKTLLDADLIRLARELSFPDFSRDGEYLAVHYIDDMREKLGSPEDDFNNFFTARLLLLLESRSIYNEAVYRDLLGNVVSSYYRDYHDHETTFRPVFLINDIIRFWRTLCLNYEHRRNRPSADKAEKNKNHLINLKLKFSRLLTCFSAIALLSRNRDIVTPTKLVDIVRLAPLDRLSRIAEMVPPSADLVRQLQNEYAWFLESTNRSRKEVLEWIGDRKTRDEAFAKGRAFQDRVYALLEGITVGTDTMRFLVV